jgi:putative alpha-1,2-mannosidase
MVRISRTPLLAFAVLPLILCGCSPQKKEPVDYVNPNLGGIGQLLSATSPNVIMPYGMMRISPITTPGITDRYLADKIYGFPAGGMTLMPMTGSAQTDPAKYASMYDHDLETATPYYYAAILEKHDIRVEYTVSAHAAYYRLTFPAGVAALIEASFVGSAGRARVDMTSPRSVIARPADHSAGGTGGETVRRSTSGPYP